MTSAGTAFRAAAALGPKPVLQYAKYQLALRSGWLRSKTPLMTWDQIEPDLATAPDPTRFPIFPFDPQQETDATSPPWWAQARQQAASAGEAVLGGRFTLFGKLEADLGVEPDWGRFAPLAGGQGQKAVPIDRHWTAYDLDGLGADVRLLWEPSRFRWLYTLGRAYRWTGDERFADGAWALMESWRADNPPNCGPHWISAQEAAFRLLALSFAYATMGPGFDWDRRAKIVRMVAGHAARIPPTLSYSRAQGNNHLLSEAVGLYTAGCLFPGLTDAERWRELGRRLLIDGFDDQVWEDGGYVQHSTNYQRLALELGLWAVHVANACGDTLPAGTVERLRAMASLLGRLADDSNGTVPNFGANDGSHLLPLSTCDFGDYRPTLQAAAAVLGGLPGLKSGPWDELALWLGTEPTAGEIGGGRRQSYPQAGLHLLEGQGGRAVLRAAKFRNRPGHADQLHLDLWSGGRDRAIDAGSYLYNGDPPWRNGLAGASVHNTLVVDGAEPMTAGGRFLWLNWADARVEERVASPDARLECVVAVHEGNWPGVELHRRWVLRFGGQMWLVLDDVMGVGRHRLTLPWLLPDGQWSASDDQLEVAWPDGQATVRSSGQQRAALYRGGRRIHGPSLADDIPQWGWRSKTYAELEPALHWVAQAESELPARLQTWWTFDQAGLADVELVWGDVQDGLAPLAGARWQGSQLSL